MDRTSFPLLTWKRRAIFTKECECQEIKDTLWAECYLKKRLAQYFLIVQEFDVSQVPGIGHSSGGMVTAVASLRD